MKYLSGIKYRNFMLFAVICLAFGGCYSTNVLITNNSGIVYDSTIPDSIHVFLNDKIDSEFHVVAELAAMKDGGQRSADDLIQKLKNEAAKLGADALVNLKIGYRANSMFEAVSLLATATAVKYIE